MSNIGRMYRIAPRSSFRYPVAGGCVATALLAYHVAGWAVATPFYSKQTSKSMPKMLEHKLKKEARKKGLKGKRRNAYVFGTLARIKKAAKGKR